MDGGSTALEYPPFVEPFKDMRQRDIEAGHDTPQKTAPDSSGDD